MNSIQVTLLREIFLSKSNDVLQLTFTDGYICQFTSFAQFEDEDGEGSPFYAQIVEIVNGNRSFSKVVPGDFLYFRLDEIQEVTDETGHQIPFGL